MPNAGAVRVHPSNVEQARAWDGDAGAYWAAHPDEFEHTLARYNPHLIAAGGIGPSARVVDVGCGTGDTSRAAARLAADVLGLELSSRMVEVARRRAAEAGLANVRFVQADAQVHPFDDDSIDLFMSRTGTMFFGDPVAAFANFARALRPGGRLAMLVWQEFARNEWIRAIMGAVGAGRDVPSAPPQGPGPFSMSDPDHVRRTLTRAGFDHVVIDGVAEPMCFGPTPEDAYRLVVGLTAWMLDGLDEPARVRALHNLRTTIDARFTPGDGVLFGSACWLVTARLCVPRGERRD